MAELNLSVVANRILGLLHSEDNEKTTVSLWGVPDQEVLRRLEGTVSKLAPLLIDAEKKSNRLELWLMRLGDELHNAENLLEELFAEANSRWHGNNKASKLVLMKQVRRFVVSTCSLLVPLVSSRFKMVIKELKEINKVLEGCADEIHEFDLEKRSEKKVQLPAVVGVAEISTRADRSPAVGGGGGFGRDKEKEEIVGVLLHAKFKEKGDVTVHSIVSAGGLGKTTLARDVLNDERVRRYFDLQIWVRVSKNFDIKRILEEVLLSATGGSEENLEMERLVTRLQKSLHGKRYLIVLDDVWNDDSRRWHGLKRVLQVGAKGSAIILTSHSARVAGIAGSTKPYHLDALTEEQSWSLLKRVAFGDQDSLESKSSDMISIGKKIARRCEGHPLVILAVGRMLYFENSEADWRFFYQNELSPAKESDILPLLKLTYDHLPSPLKHCFAYCSLFPNDHEIDVQTLIKLWMAQGFIDSQTSNHSLEDVGYGYFMNLLSRSFFHDATMDVSGRVTKCKMHDLMHDLATSVAGEQCRSSSRSIPMIYRVPLHFSFVSGLSSAEQELYPLTYAKKLRSILLPLKLPRKDRGRPHDKIFDSIISRCRFLRVLDMHALGLKRVPYSIGKLYHLRYLDLSENEYIIELPDSITELLSLQTLRLSSCFELKTLPSDIGNLINLRHLEIDGCYNLVSLPRGIGRLTNLQTLSQLVLSEDASKREDELTELRRLNNLRDELEIRNLKHGTEDMTAAYLDIIRQVRSLSLEWESCALESNEYKDTPLISSLYSELEELALNGFWGVTLFSHGFPSNLVKLSLRKCMKCVNLPPFSQCLKLKVLVLDEMTDLEYVENETVYSSTIFFPALQELWLTELPNLQGWWRTSSLESQKLPSFPCLSKLVIEDCPNLASMPLFPTLEEGLVLDSTSWNTFQLTMEQKAKPAKDEASSSDSQLSPLSKLKNLCVVGIRKFDNLEANKIEWKNLQCLQMLKFDSLPELTTVPEGLQQVASLRELHVWRCGVKELPTWITQLKSLEKLVIRVCPRLETLPEEIRGFEYLKTLEIHDCPVLLRRCEKRIGADWDKISHIETLHLG